MAVSKKKTLIASLIVTQANELVEARYNLTLGEQRLIFTMISRIQPEDDDFKPYRVSISELADFLGIDKNHIYTDCQKITKKLLEKVLEIKEPGRLLQTHWVSSADYIDGTGSVMLTFDPLLKPYLLQLKGNFTSSRLEMLLSFKSQYTMRMYSILKQYERLKCREMELEQLRTMLGIRNDQYKLYAHFRTGILEPVQKELKTKADLYFEFDEVKYGRKVGAIRFRIFTKKLTKIIDDYTCENNHSEISTSDATPSPVCHNQLLSLVPDQHRTKKTVLSLIESFEKKNGFDYVKRNILYCNAKAEKSYAGFLHNALKNDWGHDFEIDQSTPVKKKVKPKDVWEREGYATEQEYAQAMFDRQMEAFKKEKVNKA